MGTISHYEQLHSENGVKMSFSCEKKFHRVFTLISWHTVSQVIFTVFSPVVSKATFLVEMARGNLEVSGSYSYKDTIQYLYGGWWSLMVI